MVTILLIVVVAKVEVALFSTDQDIVVLQTNSEKNTNLAQMTLLSQLDQSKIPTSIKKVNYQSKLENELQQPNNSSILVLIGHGTKEGLVVGKEVLSWSNL